MTRTTSQASPLTSPPCRCHLTNELENELIREAEKIYHDVMFSDEPKSSQITIPGMPWRIIDNMIASSCMQLIQKDWHLVHEVMGMFSFENEHEEALAFNAWRVSMLERMEQEYDKNEWAKVEIMQFYSDCALFRTFLSPLLDVKLLPLLDISFLLRTCEYLHQCCRGMQRILETDDLHVPIRSYICSWSAITGGKSPVDRDRLLNSLREVFELGYISPDEYTEQSRNETNKEKHNMLRISGPQLTVNIHLNRKQKKAIATHLKSRNSYEYEIEGRGSDIFIVDVQSQIDWKIWKEFGERNQLDALIYQIVSTMGRTAIGDRKDRFGMLSTDENFVELVDGVYNRFNHGRLALLKLRAGKLERRVELRKELEETIV
jgi:hypothetical protein